MTRSARQLKIVELISEKEIETQEELVGELQRAGFDVTQATVSRDVKELGLVKINVDGKHQRYAREGGDSAVINKFTEMFKRSVVSVDSAGNIVVIKTLAGSANIAGMMIDRIKSKAVLGCVAGDDTLFAVLRDQVSADQFAESLKNLAFD